MAMTPDAGGPGAESMSAEQRDLDVAAQALRDHTDERWVEIADSMLAGVLAKAPPSHPVQGQVGSETFYVSEQVLTSYLLDAIDPIPDVEVDAIRIHADQDRYTGVTILITARHGLALLPAADSIREAAQARLQEVLGQPVPRVSVSSMHVQVEDVTPADPGLA